MATKHINDLKRAFYGGGNDAEYAWFLNGGGNLAAQKGMVFPPNGLSKFDASTRGMRHIVMYGDSIIQADKNLIVPVRGFTPSYRDILNNRYGAANVSYGAQGVWRTDAQATQDGGVWSFAGTWTATPAAVVLAAPVQHVGANRSCASGTGSSAIATWTRASGCAVTTVVFNYIDHSTIAGAVNPSYSVDGGSTWVDLPVTRTASPTLKRVTVTGLSNPTNIKVRGANSAGTSSTAHIPLIEVYGSATGVTLHNLGRDGAGLTSFIGTLGTPTTFNQWFDIVVPELLVFHESNSSTAAVDGFSTPYVEALITKLPAATDKLVLGMVPQSAGLGRTVENQAAWRGVYAAAAVKYGAGFINIRSRWGLYEAAAAAGLMDDGLHPTAAGGRDLAATIDRFLRNA